LPKNEEKDKLKRECRK